MHTFLGIDCSSDPRHSKVIPKIPRAPREVDNREYHPLSFIYCIYLIVKLTQKVNKPMPFFRDNVGIHLLTY